MKFNYKVSLTALAVFIAFSTLFYNAILKPRIDYFQNLTVDVIQLRLRADAINEICSKSTNQDNKLFKQNLSSLSKDRQKFLLEIISEFYLQTNSINSYLENEKGIKTKYKAFLEFLIWNSNQTIEYLIKSECPQELKTHEELIKWERKIILSFPKSLQENFLEFFKEID